MELNQLRYFAKVAELEHMTQASRELNISESALSRSIRQLEEELGTRLFERRGRNIVLTESGALLLSRTYEITRRVGDICAEVRNVHNVHQPVVMVARAAACLLPTMIRDFQIQYPDIAVSVIQNDNHIIASQKYDLMLSGTMMLPPSHSSAVLLDNPFRVLLPREHRLAGQHSVALKQLDGLPFIGLTPNRFISVMVDQALKTQGISVVRHVYSDDALMIRNLVELGLGFSILPKFTFRAQDKQNLCELPISDPFPVLHLVLSWKQNSYYPKSVRRFRAFALDYFGKLREEEKERESRE
ncbi:MAG: LysR family transcriptional regulator [Pyramidobacter sp.]|jgi:LysR family transcriptional activator of glutamate synthase operon